MNGLAGLLAGDLAAVLDPAVLFERSMKSPAELWQQRVLRSRAPRRLLLCSRQVGKSTTSAVLAAHVAMQEPESLVLVVSPGQRQSDELLAKIRGILRAEGVALSRDSSESVTLANGSRIVSLPGTEGTTRGFSAARLLLLDEASLIPDDTYVGVLPMVGIGGQVIGLSTPGARIGWFYDSWIAAGQDGSWERHTVTCEQSAQYTPQRIAELRSSMSARAFAAEFLCQFTGVNDAVFDPDKVQAALAPRRARDLGALLRQPEALRQTHPIEGASACP